MQLTRHFSVAGKMATLWAAMVAAILCTLLGALLLFIAALIVWLVHYVGLPASLALGGLVLVLAAIAVFLVCRLVLARMRAAKPSMAGDFLGLAGLGLRLVLMSIKRSPRKALLMAVIFGALTDYFTADRASKD